MKKIITLAQSLMQEIERYDKELIEIEKVSDYRFEENEKLKKENKLLQQQIEKMKCCENCKHHSFWGNELKCNLLDYDTELECLKSKNKWELING